MTEDIHKKFASDLYGIPKDDVTAEQRRSAKTALFFEIYSPLTGARCVMSTTPEEEEEISKYKQHLMAEALKRRHDPLTYEDALRLAEKYNDPGLVTSDFYMRWRRDLTSFVRLGVPFDVRITLRKKERGPAYWVVTIRGEDAVDPFRGHVRRYKKLSYAMTYVEARLAR